MSDGDDVASIFSAGPSKQVTDYKKLLVRSKGSNEGQAGVRYVVRLARVEDMRVQVPNIRGNDRWKQVENASWADQTLRLTPHWFEPIVIDGQIKQCKGRDAFRLLPGSHDNYDTCIDGDAYLCRVLLEHDEEEECWLLHSDDPDRIKRELAIWKKKGKAALAGPRKLKGTRK